MGFRVQRRTAAITFEGDYEGLEIEAWLDVPMRVLFEFQRAATEAPDESTFARWGDDILMSWNLEDEDGNPVPADGTGFMSLPVALVSAVIRKWAEAATGVPGPLGAPSPAGVT